jgi:anti-sigma factor RsiW
MSCGYSEERIAMWMDSGESDLPMAEIHEMNRHLASCARCLDVMAKLRESQLLARSLRVDAVNSAVLNQVHQNVMDQVADLKRAPSWVILIERSLFSGVRRKYVLDGLGSLVLASAAALGILWGVQKRVETAAELPPAPARFVAALPEPVAVSPDVNDRPQPAVVRPVKRIPTTERVTVDSSMPAVHPQQVMVKLITDDPSVVIYWSLD